MPSIKNTIALIASLTFLFPSIASETKLADAAEKNNTALIDELIASKAHTDAAQVDGMTALLWASYHDNTNAALALLEAGAEPSSKNRYGISPVNLACSNGNVTLVKALLDAGTDPNATLNGGETLLMTSARVGKLEITNALINAGADVNATERRDQTAIMWAAAAGFPEIVKALAAAGADPHEALNSGYTPFFFAVREGHKAVVDVLLDLGADINEIMEVENGNAKSAKNGTSPLILAMENGHFDLAMNFLDRGADPNDARSGQTPLHALVRVRKPDRGEGAAGEPPPQNHGDVDSLTFARELVARGANVNAQLTRGRKAGGAHTSMIGATPFFQACDTADIFYMKLLVELGADPTLTNEIGTTPLMVAAGIGSHAPEEEAGTPAECLVAVQYLVSLGANVNAIDERGETAMHGAAYKNAPEVAAFLNSKGADIQIWNTENSQGWTPLNIAQGYRPGNFKPSFSTIDTISDIMLARGAKIPTEKKEAVVPYAN